VNPIYILSTGVWRRGKSRGSGSERLGQIWHDVSSIWIWERFVHGYDLLSRKLPLCTKMLCNVLFCNPI